MNKQAGFTIAEILMVATLISVLAGFILVSVAESSASSRDAERQTDLRNIQAALELYKVENGRYPESCNPAGGMATNNEGHWLGVWSGEIGTDYECEDGSASYIIGLAPEFIPVLPKDPRRNGTDSGYVYATNPDGSVYKLMALNTVETEVVDYSHPLVRCGNIDLPEEQTPCKESPTAPVGGFDTFNAQCQNASDINDTYAVSGGYAPRGYRFPQMRAGTEQTREYFTERIRCK